jgi:leader peptidase (prepilin peptidase)/N-methyltransferase
MEQIFAFVFGIIIGSFLNVCIVRLPQGQSVTKPRSHCPKCKRAIAWYDNIPILSYAILGGRCRHCKQRISARYPFVEALNGLTSILLYVKFGFGMEWITFLAFSSALLVLAFVDIDHRILPDRITLNGIWVGVFSSVVLAHPSPFVSRLLGWVGVEVTHPRATALIASLVGILVGGGLLWFVGEAYLRLRGVEGMGFGDVKMMAMVGAFLGAPLTLFTIMVGSLIGSIIGLAVIQFGGKSRDYELPFGTFLSAAAIVAVLYGEELIRLYQDLFWPGL